MNTDKQAELKNGHLQTNLPKSDTGAPEVHPLASVIGGFADDSLWEEFLEQVAQGRRELAQMDEAVE